MPVDDDVCVPAVVHALRTWESGKAKRERDITMVTHLRHGFVCEIIIFSYAVPIRV